MLGTVQELIRERFGANAHPAVNRSVSSLGVTAGRVLINDPDRLAAIITNLSLNRVYLGPFNDVAATKGIRLDPGGAALGLIWDEDFDITGWEWFGLADAAGSPILTVEYLIG